MKQSNKLVFLAIFGALASRAVYADLLCAGPEGQANACAVPCSNQVVNDEAGLQPNNGKFNVGGGNQGDGNVGFQNVGNFNIVPGGGLGNCLQAANQLTGFCDVNNANGQIVLRFCQVYPTDNKCSPSGYLAEYSDALKAQIPAAVATCTGGAPYPPISPVPTTTPLPPSPGKPVAPTAPITPPAPIVPTPSGAIPPAKPVTPPAPLPTVLPPASGFTPVSDNKANLITLLTLFEEHIAQEKALGRKMK